MSGPAWDVADHGYSGLLTRGGFRRRLFSMGLRSPDTPDGSSPSTVRSKHWPSVPAPPTAILSGRTCARLRPPLRRRLSRGRGLEADTNGRPKWFSRNC